MPVKVIDAQSQQEVEISAAELQRDIQQGTGQYVIPAGNLTVTQGGKVGKVGTSDALTAIAQGARLVDDDEAAQIRVRREESDTGSQIQGAFEAGLRGASFGLTDLAAREAGVDMERMRARQQALGGLGTAIDLAGSIATGSAIAKGVTGAAKAGARAAGVDLASGLTAPSLARTVVHTATQGAVEGFAAGAGREVSEASLGDRDIVASQVLAQGGYGSLFGAGAGALIPGVVAAGAGLARVGAKPIKAILGKATSASDDGSSLITRIIGSDAETRAARSRVWAAAAGVDEDVAARLAGDLVDQPDALRRAMDEAPRVGEEVAESLRVPIERLRAARDGVRREFGGAQKIRHVERNLPKSVDQLVTATDAAAKQLDKLEGMLSNVSQLANRTDVDDIRKMIAEARLAISARASTATGRTSQRVIAATAFRELDKVKQGVFQIKAAWDRIARSGAPTRESQVMTELLGGVPGAEGKSVYGRLRSFLEDENTWDKAGTIQQEMNRASAKALDARRLLKGSAGGRLLDTRTPIVDNADLLTVARQFGRFQGATKTELLEDAIAAEREYLEAAARNLDLSPTAKQALAEYRAAAGGVDGAIRSKRELVRMLDDVEHFRSREGGRSVSIGIGSNLSTLLGSGLGSMVGGIPGAMIGAAAATALRPYTLVRKLAAIQARTSGANAAQARAIGDFLGRIASGSLRSAEKGSRLAGRASAQAAAKEAGRTERLRLARKRTAQLNADPSLLASEIKRMTADIEDVAPNVATAIGDNVRRAVTYLASKQPPSYKAEWSPSPALVDPVAEATYERCEEGTLRPWDALAKLSSGNFTKEHAEALQYVHSAIYKSVQSMAMEALAKAQAGGKSVPLEDASQLSIMFNVPADPTLALAGGIGLSMTPPANEPGGPTPGGKQSAQSIDTARYETPVQQIGQIK